MRFLFLSTFVLAIHFQTNAQSSVAIENLIKASGVSLKDLGVVITETTGVEEKIIFENKPEQLLTPASITKIATASAVLSAFPPGTKFKTELLSDSAIEGGRLKGNLYFRGGGDPGFVSENLWFLVNQFIRSGIKTIDGDIKVDDTIFDQVRFDDSRESNRVDRAYDAPVGGLSFNWNAVNVFVRPGATGEKARVFLDPENSLVKLDNRTKTVSKGSSDIFTERKDNTIIVTGQIRKGDREITIYKNILQPEFWAGANLIEFLNQRGVQVKGKVTKGKTPPSAEVLASVDSKPIEAMLVDMNKFSNNFVAEMLTKQISSGPDAPGSLAGGMHLIRSHLKQIGVKENQFSLVNPSGLTRDNKISARAIWHILNHIHQDLRLFPEFIVSLPIAGIDGTLKKRMRGENGERWVRGKTGFINGVVSLAGYAGRKNGQTMTFVFMYNGSADESKVRSLFDNILNSLLE